MTLTLNREVSRLSYDIGRDFPTYEGFDVLDELIPGDQVVIAKLVGLDPELWMIDTPEGVAELKKMYEHDFPRKKVEYLILDQAP